MMSIDFNSGIWLNEPQSWKTDKGSLTMTTDATTICVDMPSRPENAKANQMSFAPKACILL